MGNSDSRLFIKSDAVYVTVVFASVLLFIGLLAAQIFSSVTSTRYFIGAALIFVAFLMNIFEGKFGYYISFALNFVQFMIYTYEYIMMRNESAPLLLVMTIVNMFVDLLLQYYVIKVAEKIRGIEDAKRNERGKAIRKELEDEMFSRTSLIVNHESMGSHQVLSEAIGRNLTSSIDPLTTLPGRDMITRAIGHKSMDLFIQNMAHRLREAADPTDMVARIDDADFVILFRRALSGEAETKYADKLAKEASRAFAAGIDSMNACIHYGFSHYPSDSRHAGELIAKAEERMSKAANITSGVPDKEDETYELPGTETFKDKTKNEIVAVFERAISDGTIYMA